ncbi:tail protein X [Acinetobacter johnsonii]|uniref:Tail protein X n=1 Tax=Acinetobacter johnsonii TaxID=40214 RepID=A0AA42IH44_ACIJO|nr:tail protein X [Acinetobacter johnsonii]MDH0657529.1 tail protein X [Acinetobacter johnsonii]QQT57247.1 tail protein X [Acinetobacter johnsonii]
MAQYLTKAGDMLDEIAYLYYGNTNNKVVERILEVNFSISQYDALLPAGVLIELPEVQQSTETRKVKLWD